MKIAFEASNLSFLADFNDSLTAQEIIQKLPIKSTVSKWGDEIYFKINFKACAENATMDVKIGDIAYWPQGKCLCVFFGPTPQSVDEKPVPASPVVIVGKAKALAQELKKIEMGDTIAVSFL